MNNLDGSLLEWDGGIMAGQRTRIIAWGQNANLTAHKLGNVPVADRHVTEFLYRAMQGSNFDVFRFFANRFLIKFRLKNY